VKKKKKYVETDDQADVLKSIALLVPPLEVQDEIGIDVNSRKKIQTKKKRVEEGFEKLSQILLLLELMKSER